MSLYFVEITPVGGQDAKVAEVLSTVQNIVMQNTDKNSLRFKVFGENKIVLIAKGDEPQKVLDDLNSQVGGAVTVKTIPVRSYETFAETVLGVDKSVCIPNTAAFDKPQKLLLVRFTVDFEGISVEEFMKIWKEEATAGLTGRAQGHIDSRSFKAIAERDFLLIFNLPDAEDLDAALVSLPFALNPGTANGFRFPSVREVKPF